MLAPGLWQRQKPPHCSSDGLWEGLWEQPWASLGIQVLGGSGSRESQVWVSQQEAGWGGGALTQRVPHWLAYYSDLGIACGREALPLPSVTNRPVKMPPLVQGHCLRLFLFCHHKFNRWRR